VKELRLRSALHTPDVQSGPRPATGLTTHYGKNLQNFHLNHSSRNLYKLPVPSHDGQSSECAICRHISQPPHQPDISGSMPRPLQCGQLLTQQKKASNICMEEGEGLEPPRRLITATPVFKTGALPIRLTFRIQYTGD
jgi:hypothetical protein